MAGEATAAAPPAPSRLARLTVVIPARDEEACIAATVEQLHQELRLQGVPHEIIAVDDGSCDETYGHLLQLKHRIPELRPLRNPGPHGFGHAIRLGLDHMSGDAVVIMMADASDDAGDVVRYWRVLNEGWDCVFGSRFVAGGNAIDYPRFKLLLNRLANSFLQRVFGIQLNDTTNAFKAYRREVIAGCRPLMAAQFELTVELPLKAITRGFTWTVIPITWRNRKTGEAKLKIKEMGSRYLFTILSVWLEKHSRHTGEWSVVHRED